MSTVRSVLAAAVLLTLLTAPGLTQETVRQTFRLMINGDPPEGEAFKVVIIIPRKEGNAEGAIELCGDPTDPTSPLICKGGGAVYTRTVEAGAGAKVWYSFQRMGPDGKLIATFAGKDLAPDTDNTFAAYYNYATGQGGLGEDPSVPALPNTGGGGAADGGLAAGILAGLVLTVGAALYRVQGR